MSALAQEPGPGPAQQLPERNRPGAVVVEARRARHSFKNSRQVSPFVVPAALAACHCSPHCFMTFGRLRAIDPMRALCAAILSSLK